MRSVPGYAKVQWGRRVFGWSLVLCACLACGQATTRVGTTPVGGADTVPDIAVGDSAVSATMLRVLAETADEFRTGRPVFLVAAFRFPHKVIGGFPTRAAAESARGDVGAGYGVFGPFLTPEDEIPDSTPKVIAVRLELATTEGNRSIDVNPDTVDALFFSESVVDKFVIPYYTRVYGLEYALELERRLGKRRPKGHCLSRMCLVADDGVEYLDPAEDAPPP